MQDPVPHVPRIDARKRANLKDLETHTAAGSHP